ncbi:phosphoribosylanthranilate isomerase [Cyanobium sp. HWJ4-Hawea]|nr:phosphoribosylanthranilate isomerase [Cyanobium sp. HWJ4-Hawea]
MGFPSPNLKICGLTRLDQAQAVAGLGVAAIGVIAVPQSPRFLPQPERRQLFAGVAEINPLCQGVLVVADPSDAELDSLKPSWGHRVLQLHGGESPQRCSFLRQQLGCEIWKALRIRSAADLAGAMAYGDAVDALLLDAWVPDQLGGSGHRIPLEWLEGFAPPLPWWLAGGMRADRVTKVLARLKPDGLDASSGVERAPGDKDLQLVEELVAAVRDNSQDQGTSTDL